MANDLSTLVSKLPEKNLTTLMLKTLDFVVPGEWENPRDVWAMARSVSNVTDERALALIEHRADALFSEDKSGYQRALKIYRTVDVLDRGVAAAAMANKIGQKVSFLGVLERITPKPDTAQAVDAGLKFVAEVAAYFSLHGWPRDGVGDFGRSLKHYANAELMRLSAWIVFDGIIPLGPDFVRRILESMSSLTNDKLGNNKLFSAISTALPGQGLDEKRGFIQRALSSSAQFLNDFAQAKDLDQKTLGDKLRKFVDVSDGGLDVLAAALDAGTNYFAHTGTQTVARVALYHAWLQLISEGKLLPPASGESRQGPIVLTLGRDDTPGVNDVVILAPMVSGQHCEVTFADDGWHVRDLGSSNGTAVNHPGRTIVEASVTGRDVLYLGSYRYPVALLARNAAEMGATGELRNQLESATIDYSHRAAMEEARDRALLEAICLAALSDGEFSDAEREHLLGTVSDLPAYRERDKGPLAELIDQTIERIQQRGFGPSVREIVETLPANADRHRAFTLAVMVKHADDEVLQSESVFIHQFGGSLGLSTEDRERIVADVRERVGAPSA